MASAAQGSGARSRVPMRGARMEERLMRRSTPLALSFTTRQSPDTTSTTTPKNLSLRTERARASGWAGWGA